MVAVDHQTQRYRLLCSSGTMPGRSTRERAAPRTSHTPRVLDPAGGAGVLPLGAYSVSAHFPRLVSSSTKIADVIVCHMGLTTGGTIGADTARTLDDCVTLSTQWAAAARSARSDVIVLVHDAPSSTRPMHNSFCRMQPESTVSTAHPQWNDFQLRSRLPRKCASSPASPSRIAVPGPLLQIPRWWDWMVIYWS